MKMIFFLLCLSFAGHVYSQNLPGDLKDSSWLKLDVPPLPFIQTDTLPGPDANRRLKPQPQNGFYDNMKINIPDLSEIEQMPMMPIDTSANFIILKKRLYNYKDEDEQVPETPLLEKK